MYHDWWDRTLDERLSIQQDQAEMMEGVESDEEKEEIKAGGWVYIKQNLVERQMHSSCCRLL